MSRFRRLVLELGHFGADPGTVRQAAAFARLLDAELHALFVEDETLLHASALPFAREISVMSGQWRPLAPERLEAELRVAADRARRTLTHAASAAGVGRSFEVRRGDFALQIGDICIATDLIVVPSPRGMGIGTPHNLSRLRDTALRSAASVLFLPPGVGRRHGMIVALIEGEADPGLEVARRIAAQQREGLLVLALEGGESDMAAKRLAANTVQDIVAALGEVKERLIVMTHRAGGDIASQGAALAGARGVPVLVVEPE
jgi:hypothetical protein